MQANRYNTGIVDSSYFTGKAVESASFEVPAGTDTTTFKWKWFVKEQCKRFGYHLEKQGFKVLGMSHEFRDTNMERPEEPDRWVFRILAAVHRKPVEIHYEIPDSLVPAALKKGMKLAS